MQVSDISIDLHFTVYCTVINYGTVYEWELINEIYKKENESWTKSILEAALSCSKGNLISYFILLISLNSVHELQSHG